MLSLPGLSKLCFAYGLSMSGGPGSCSPGGHVGKTHPSGRGRMVHTSKFKTRKIGWGERAEVILSTVQCLPLNMSSGHLLQNHGLFLEKECFNKGEV